MPPILLTGSKSTWTETGHGQAGHHDCSACKNRSIADERRKGLNIICLRCFVGTWDRDQVVEPERAGPDEPFVLMAGPMPTRRERRLAAFR